MIILSAAAILSGCRAEQQTGRPEEPDDTKLPVKVSILSENVFGTSFWEGEKAGLFVVNGAGSLTVSESVCFNLPVTGGHDGRWNTEEPLYYPYPEEPASLYCVYPYSSYDGEIQDAKALQINVNADQRRYQDYRASDIQWGKTEGVIPSENSIEIDMKHIVSRLRVVLEAGSGWDSTEIMGASVRLYGFYAGGRLDVESGTLLPESILDEMDAHNDGNAVFSAFLLPQPAGRVCRIRINAGNDEDELQVSAALEPGKDYTCTVKLDRFGGKFSVAINGWETDDNDYGGSV